MFLKNMRHLASNSLPNRIEYNKLKSTELLENSFAGILGKTIEPVIKPLGYDWKIGIALITSFAAREVFVGTMATLYSVGDDKDENNATLRQKMNAASQAGWDKSLHTCHGFISFNFLCIGHAMHEYTGNCKT